MKTVFLVMRSTTDGMTYSQLDFMSIHSNREKTEWRAAEWEFGKTDDDTFYYVTECEIES